MVRRQYLKRYWITYFESLQLLKVLKKNFMEHRSLVYKVQLYNGVARVIQKRWRK